jgi:CDP-paratose 2-epimerase
MVPTDDFRLLVTGGAGFVGANLCVALAERHPDWKVASVDNLKRRGSELNLPRLRAAGVDFTHGDVRELADLEAVGRFDAMVEASAEPSVLAGTTGSTSYVVSANLLGAYQCLELVRRYGAQLVFLSTSRVYPVLPLESAAWRETSTRFEWLDEQELAGISSKGVSEQFPLEGWRTLYGATKLCAEHLIAEYAQTFGVRAVVNRCGVVAGPWQMGKVDQGVFTLWVLNHHLGRELSYIGYGGSGKQVRDLLHVGDLIDLIEKQLMHPELWAGVTVNVGGGADCSLSLYEATILCRELTGNAVPVGDAGETRAGDVRIYLSDCSRLFERTDWRPRRDPRGTLGDILNWVRDNEPAVRGAIA